MRICDLRDKEVINCCDCRRLGHVIDIEFDPNTGCILQLIVPCPARFCGFFGCDSEYVIAWPCIRQIGPDIILVEVNPEKIQHKL